MSIPEGLGQADQEAELLPGETYTYTSEFHNRCSVCEQEICGEYFYILLAVYGWGTFPTPMEWVYISEKRYQVAGDEEIVIENAELVRNW